jgi:hypothetical protein
MAGEYHMHPTWWTGQENSDWDRVRAALKRYWQQVKWDLSLGAGRDLNQGLIDTVKQALGIDPLPLPNQPVPRRLRERATQASSPGIGQRIGQSVGPRIDHRHAHSWT